MDDIDTSIIVFHLVKAITFITVILGGALFGMDVRRRGACPWFFGFLFRGTSLSTAWLVQVLRPPLQRSMLQSHTTIINAFGIGRTSRQIPASLATFGAAFLRFRVIGDITVALN